MNINLKITTIIVAVVLVVGAVFVGVWIYLSKKPSVPVAPKGSMLTIDPSTEQESATISRCVGVVESINNSILTIKTEKAKSFFDDRRFEFTITDKTKIYFSDFDIMATKSDRLVFLVQPNFTTNDSQNVQQVNLANFALADIDAIKTGMSLAVVGDRDLRTSSSANAVEIFVIR